MGATVLVQLGLTNFVSAALSNSPNFMGAKGQTISKAMFFTQDDSEFRSFFGRIEESIICFRDLLSFDKQFSNFENFVQKL